MLNHYTINLFLAEAVGFEPTSLYDHGFQDRCNNHSATLPFLIFQRTLSFNLLRRVESNYRPPDYETDELPLLYPAICVYNVCFLIAGTNVQLFSAFQKLILFLIAFVPLRFAIKADCHAKNDFARRHFARRKRVP